MPQAHVAHFHLPRFCLLLLLSITVAPAFGQSNTMPGPCSSAALQIHLLPPAESEPVPDEHLLVFEIQNISSVACMPSNPSALLLPQMEGSYQFEAQHYGGTPLSPQEWVHVLFAWVSVSAPEVQCTEHANLKLTFSADTGQGTKQEAAAEVRNLNIRSCHDPYLSEYRSGHYSLASHVPQEWLNRIGATDQFQLPIEATWSHIARNTPSVQADLPTPRTMLGDYLQVRLRFNRQADHGCPFRLIRKREATEVTQFWIQNCVNAANADQWPTPAALEAGVLRLGITRLGLAPLHTGPLEYNLLSQISTKPAEIFAETSIHLLAKDPTPPTQAPVAEALPPCQDAQVQVRALPVENIGKWQALRAYQARNMSDTSCSVAGVPDLAQIDERGNRLSFYDVHPCPNCQNLMFTPRPNGRVDLRPGDSAHFLIAATAINTEEDPWMHCSETPGVVLTLSPGSKPIELPLGMRKCAAIDISAWRPGVFDHDPRNVAWSQRVKENIPGSPPVPAACSKTELQAFGKPVFLAGSPRVALGISLSRQELVFGDDVILQVWALNTSHAPQSVSTCGDLDYFKARALEVYDAYGHRVLSRREAEIRERCKADPGTAEVEWVGFACSRNFPIPVAADTCISGNTYDFTMNLKERYHLPPGQYTVRLRDPEKRPSSVCKTGNEPAFIPVQGDIQFTVLQP